MDHKDKIITSYINQLATVNHELTVRTVENEALQTEVADLKARVPQTKE